jgi:hypothetical protein
VLQIIAGALALVAAPRPAAALTPDHRLDHVVHPTLESVRLEIDARRPDYRGAVRIVLRVEARRDHVALWPRCHHLACRNSLVEQANTMRAALSTSVGLVSANVILGAHDPLIFVLSVTSCPSASRTVVLVKYL